MVGAWRGALISVALAIEPPPLRLNNAYILAWERGEVGKPFVFHSQFLDVCLCVVVSHLTCRQHSPCVCMCECCERGAREQKCMTVTRPQQHVRRKLGELAFYLIKRKCVMIN